MNYPETCPHCSAWLDDGDIYDRLLMAYEDSKRAREAAECYGWTKENPKRFSRIVGITNPDLDRVVYFECPDCKRIIDL